MAAASASPPFSSIDLKFILQSLAENGLIIKDPSSPQLFLTSQELQNGSITTEQFLTASEGFISVLPGLSGVVDVSAALTTLAGQIKGRAEADNLQARYLSGLVTARGLEPESVKIVVAVKEVVEDAFDDHEVLHLQADSLSIRDFLREETIPFLKEVEKRGAANVPVDTIRRRRAQLKEKLEIQRKNVNVHLQRVESGIENMMDCAYYVKTNHLPRYAAAAALEVLLRGYHALMGKFDPEDIMVDFDYANVLTAAEERVESMKSLFKRYAENRLSLEGTKSTHEEELWHEFKYYVYDAGAPNDQLCPKVKIANIASLFPRGSVNTKEREDGSFRYSNESISGNDRSTEPGQRLHQAVEIDIGARLAEKGVIWRQHFQPHVDRIELVLDTVLSRGNRLDRLLQDVKFTKMPKTVPLSRFKPEGWGDAIPFGKDTVGNTKLYYMIYHIAGMKIIGEWSENWVAVPCGSTTIHPKPTDIHRCEILVDVSECEWVSHPPPRLMQRAQIACIHVKLLQPSFPLVLSLAYLRTLTLSSNKFAPQIPASNGDIPPRAVNMAGDQEQESSTPFYIANVILEDNNGRACASPADMIYEPPDGEDERPVWKYARYCDGETTKESTDYRILCYKEE